MLIVIGVNILFGLTIFCVRLGECEEDFEIRDLPEPPRYIVHGCLITLVNRDEEGKDCTLRLGRDKYPTRYGSLISDEMTH